ncbi:MAG: DUF4838 domain-containing protein [Aureibaculum sp.]|nr:DUF4838 domain-containing protein [Aureibaculum sp.]
MKKWFLIKSLFVFALLIIGSCNKNNSLQIVKNGVSNYEIAFMGKTTKSQYQSAELLKKYIDEISGADIAIVDQNSQNIDKQKIFIGKLTTDSLQKHELSINVEGQNLIISGGSDDAIQHAVLVFLEDFLGCKWYTPTVEEIPSNPTIEIPKSLNFNYTPDITTRTVHSRLFYENPAFAEKQKVTNVAFPYYVPNARVHTFNKFMPEELFFKDHPEYYALRGNKRTPTQLCLTNQKVLEIVKDSVTSLFQQYPDAHVISVSQDDNQQYCECENCSTIDKEEDSHSGTMIHFVNKIAKNFPDKTISTLAYQHTRKPPKIKPEENVLITLCSIECDRSAPIQEKCQDFADDLIGWGKLTNNIRIWDYTTQFTNFLAPFPNLLTIQPNIKFFRDQHTKWIFEQHSNNPSELFELRSYLMAKLLWNPDQDFNALITEFTDGYYKEAGIYVRKYIDLVHEKILEDKDFFLFLYGDPSQAFDSYLNAELLDQYNTFFNNAEKAVSYDPEIVARVQVARLSIDYAILEASKKGLSEKYQLITKNDRGEMNVNPFVKDKLENYYQTCNKANITLMNEMGFTVEEYYTNYKKAILVASKPNKAKGKKVTLLTKPKKYANEDPQTLTDGALGGNGFYANWLGFEGNDLEAIIDLEAEESISSISMAFLKVTNHIVFYPLHVTYYYSIDNMNYVKLGTVNNKDPLVKTTKVNEIQYFNLEFSIVNARYIKIVAESMKQAPYWHHGSGLPSWIFADEVIID